MKFDLGWMQSFLEEEVEADTLAEALTHCGFLVETRDRVDSGEVWDMEATTNRPDVMCHRGMAREAAVATDNTLRPLATAVEEGRDLSADLASVEIQAPELCRRYVARVLRGVKLVESPKWLRDRLENCGVRPINAVVDATNYVLLETGQPLHAFDLSLLEGRRIIVRRANEGEVLETLDGVERKLRVEDLVIADGVKPVALAGIMGGANSEISEETVDILLESAHFEAIPIRRSARRLGMHTEASHRFERGTDPEIVRAASDRAAALIAELTGAVICRGVIDVYPRPWTPVGLEIDSEKLSEFAGVEISTEKAARIFDGLEFKPRVEASRIQVEVPSFRVDVEIEADLFEEVIRHVGYAAVPAVLPTLRTPPGRRHPNWELVDRGREAAMACGLAEVITYAFIDPEADRDLQGWPLSPGKSIELGNPLAKTQGVLRISLLPGLIAAARESLSLGGDSAALFEEGRVFGLGEDGKPREAERLGILFAGAGPGWPGVETVAFPELKGVVESMLRDCGFSEISWKAGGTKWLDETKGAAVLEDASGRVIGLAGALGALDLGVRNLKKTLWVAEIDLGAAPEQLPLPVFEALPRYPSVIADMTVEHRPDLEYGQLEEAVRKAAGELVEEICMTARFTGKGLPEDRVRTTIRLVYRHPERTLVQEEINEAQDGLRSKLASSLGVSFA